MSFRKRLLVTSLLFVFFLPQLLPAEELPYKNGPYSFVPLLQRVVRKVGKKGPVRFVVLGDSKHSKRFPTVLQFAKSFNPDLIIDTGDFVSRGSALNDWFKFEKEVTPFARSIPFIPVEGNHEGGPNTIGDERFCKFFDLEKSYYFFDVSNCRFIVLSWNFHKDAEQVTWLEQALKGAAGRHIFVSAHNPFFTVGHKSRGSVPNTETRFTRMFTKYGVTCVFAGHDHVYYRTDRGGVTYVISAGAGAGIYDLDRKGEALPGDIYMGVDPGGGGYLRKDAVTGAEVREQTPYFVVEVLVQGPKVVCRTVNIDGKEWERFIPARLKQPARSRR